MIQKKTNEKPTITCQTTIVDADNLAVELSTSYNEWDKKIKEAGKLIATNQNTIRAVSEKMVEITQYVIDSNTAAQDALRNHSLQNQLMERSFQDELLMTYVDTLTANMFIKTYIELPWWKKIFCKKELRRLYEDCKKNSSQEFHEDFIKLHKEEQKIVENIKKLNEEVEKDK